MYRHVHIRKSTNLESVNERISNLSKARGINIWRWVRTFFVDSYPDFDKITTMLTKTVDLIEVYIHTPIRSEVLVTLRQCCPSLRSLKIWVDPESHEAMAQVGLFEHVQQMHIVTYRSETNRRQSMDPLADLPPWNMPAVTYFFWMDPWNKLPHEANFISRCRFPHLTHLDIPLASPNAYPHMCRFLDAHRNIRSLTIQVSDEGHLNIVPFVRARNLEIYCVSRCPPRAFVSLLRPEVKTLELEFSSATWKDYNHELTTSLWDLLTQFAVEDDKLLTLEKIYLHTPEHHDLAPTTQNGLDLNTLRSHILPLKGRGVRVFVNNREICV
jgi:hypothetical protein